MKKSLLYVLLVLASFQLKAQTDSAWLHRQIRSSADSMAKGFVTKDWELFIRYTYPPLIGTLGGKEEFIKQVKERIGNIPDSAWKRYEAGKVLQVVHTERDLQAIIEFHSVLEWMGTRITTKHYLVGESWNGGKHWTFFDPQNDPEIARSIKPDLSDSLVIPPRQEKVEPLDK